MQLHFAKYQGAGNDFILLDNRGGNLSLTREQIVFLCDRRFGIGADGLMLLEEGLTGSDFRMRYYNSDGGEAMCGNGARCMVRFADDLGVGGSVKHFQAIDGPHEAELLPDGNIRLQMIDVAGIEKLPPADACGRDGYFLDTGTAHYVEFTDDVLAQEMDTIGKTIRHNARFAPQGGTNVNLVQILGPGHIRIRTFERGVEAETLACGTGITAGALAAHALYQPEQKEFTVEAMGGKLGVKFAGDREQGFREIFLTGPAERVFTGKIDLKA